MASFELAAQLKGHDGSVRTIAVLAEGQQLVSGGDDGAVKR